MRPSCSSAKRGPARSSWPAPSTSAARGATATSSSSTAARCPASLIESELFGRERGAFTGALTAQAGRFELANGGTVFLDEIGELPLELQPKLLRVLQEGRSIGSAAPGRRASMFASSPPPIGISLEDVRRGRFRRDLFYRLNVFPITMPALRERREDLPALVRHLCDRLGRQLGRADRAHRARHARGARAVRLAGQHPRAGERASSGPHPRARRHARSDGLHRRAARRSRNCRDGPRSPLVDVERDHIRQVLLDDVGWRIEGAAGAAHILGLRPSTLRTRMSKLGIQRPMRDAEA